jgi:exonuclease III
MKTCGYNCRGLGSDPATRSLLKIWRQHRADILYLSETHLDGDSGDRLRIKLGYAHKFVVPSNGRAGGLMLLWDQHLNIQLKYKHTNYIDVLVSGDTPDKDWRITGLYGESVWRHK